MTGGFNLWPWVPVVSYAFTVQTQAAHMDNSYAYELNVIHRQEWKKKKEEASVLALPHPSSMWQAQHHFHFGHSNIFDYLAQVECLNQPIYQREWLRGRATTTAVSHDKNNNNNKTSTPPKWQ